MVEEGVEPEESNGAISPAAASASVPKSQICASRLKKKDKLALINYYLSKGINGGARLISNKTTEKILDKYATANKIVYADLVDEYNETYDERKKIEEEKVALIIAEEERQQALRDKAWEDRKAEEEKRNAEKRMWWGCLTAEEKEKHATAYQKRKAIKNKKENALAEALRLSNEKRYRMMGMPVISIVARMGADTEEEWERISREPTDDLVFDCWLLRDVGGL